MAAILATSSLAHADPVDTDPLTATRVLELQQAIVHGASLPWTSRADHTALGGVLSSHAGLDTDGQGLLSTSLEWTVVRRVTLRGTLSSELPMTDGVSLVDPTLGVVVDVLRQRGSGVDLAVGADYDRVGFNQVPAIVGRIAVGRRLGAIHVIANGALGAGLEEAERYGELRLGGFRHVRGGLHAGIDSRFAIDLERDGDEPAGEPDWELQGGPAATYRFGRVAVSALVGVAASRLRLVDGTRTGALGLIGASTLF